MRVLHLLSQRPMLTGSGVTLDALARHAHEDGWQQHFLVGAPAHSPVTHIAGLGERSIDQVLFERPPLDYPVVGMSDVMPYPSRTFASLSPAEVATYVDTWRAAVAQVVERFAPDVIHSHHVWLLSSLVPEVTDTPTVVHCHGTGLRQLELCPHLAERVVEGCRKNARVLALHRVQAEQLAQRLRIPAERISVVGAGYRDEVFWQGDEPRAPRSIVYAGKLSSAKGVRPLIDAIAKLDDVTLHLVGGGSGPDAERIRERAAELPGRVVAYDRLEQDELASLLRRSAVFVLPSFYEGLPLVVIEALACGCQVVATELPGLVDEIAPHVGDTLELVPLPRLVGPDRPVEADLPAFVDDLARALERALAKPSARIDLERFRWAQVFARTRDIWRRCLS